MEKIKRWHIATLIIVFALTLYNILPTLIYYSKPLSKGIEQNESKYVIKDLTKRLAQLDRDTLGWIKVFNKNLGIEARSIEVNSSNSKLIEVKFAKDKEAALFKKFLPHASSLISFAPAKLSLDPNSDTHPRTVTLVRSTPLIGQTEQFEKACHYSPVFESEQTLNSEYQNYILNRAKALAKDLSQPQTHTALIRALEKTPSSPELTAPLLQLAQQMQEYQTCFGADAPLTHQLLSQLTPTKEGVASKVLIDSLERLIVRSEVELQAKKENAPLSAQDLELLKKTKSFAEKKAQFLDTQPKKSLNFSTNTSVFSLQNSHPFIESVSVNWKNNQIEFELNSLASSIQSLSDDSAATKLKKEKLNQLLINEIARVSQLTAEKIQPSEKGYVTSFQTLEDVQGLITVDLKKIAQSELQALQASLNQWERTSIDLQNNVFATHNYEDYCNLDALSQKFGLILYAPVLDAKESNTFNPHSIYVVAKGIEDLFEKYQTAPEEKRALFLKDFQNLQSFLQSNGFLYSYLSNEENDIENLFQKSLIFEKPKYYSELLSATREDFVVLGDAQVATLELTDLGQRIHIQNKIETQAHEELVKWKEDYQAAQVDLQNPHSKFFIPKPTKNIYWENFKLSFRKYFRGDNRKVIKWGLDLSGGQSILVGLRDLNNKPVTGKEDLQQGADELTQRVNKMGLSEVDIRVEGSHISLDFPSSKGLTAQELIKGSTMTFHVVNEALSSASSPLFEESQSFLQNVYNEALITHRTDIDSINEIAWKQIGGEENSSQINPRTPQAKKLIDSGLKLKNPKLASANEESENAPCKIAAYQGEEVSQWRGQSNPLVWVYAPSALDGTQLENIRTSYDPKEGNLLAFEVKSSHTSHLGEKVNPREQLYFWTSKYAKDRIAGTSLEKFTPNRGWRLAIVLNNRIINDPQLNQALTSNVQVSGGFTLQEINRLASDLKAGSLSFKPEILSQNNVSADLGQKERMQGIWATLVALALVVAVMVTYYRFSGLVASVAVLFNLLIIWATLQNLQATLTLSGIAGIILTLGMAVDANVLVFERIREEMKHTKKLSQAIYTGYRQAFSAIFDSNFTTVLAALILLNFDTGPIKGLAITLTIGITSSMFTALFMTQVFFMKWAEKTKQTRLNMANWFQVKTRNFLAHAKWITATSLALLVIGSTLFVLQHKSIFGMDFTGGYSFNVELQQRSGLEYRKAVSQALLKSGAQSTDFQIRELNQPNMLRIQLSSSLEEKGRPFYLLPQSVNATSMNYSWQSNPRISWVVNALETAGLKVDAHAIQSLDSHWSEMSGQLSKTTRNHAFYALTLAMLIILAYISFRFEIKFALSALLCTLHDVFVCLSLLAILHAFGVPIQLNMQVIAALMTIIGYSLNDTIIVFDRIREEKKLKRKASFNEIINLSLSVTLNRTLMTSITTFIVLFALLVLGGAKIFDFSLMMSLGVIVGTLSSLFVAPFILSYLENKEPSKNYKASKKQLYSQ